MDKQTTKALLEMLAQDCRLSDQQLSTMLNLPETEVRQAIAQLEKDKAILRYKASVNWAAAQIDQVSAIIELNIAPQRGVGYDRVAERIYRYPQVKSLYLVSGAYDLAVMVVGDTMQEISNFVAQHLACLEEVRGTKTNFIMCSYKVDSDIYDDQENDKRLVIS